MKYKELINNINKETILIVPSTIKSNILESLSMEPKLINIKIMSFNELKKGILFDYKDTAFEAIRNEFEIKKYETVECYLDNIYYIDDNNYSEKRLKKLVDMKNFLSKEGHLLYNSLFKKSLNNKDIIVYGFDYIDRFNQKLLSLTNQNIKIIPKDYPIINNYKIYEFETIEEEVDYVFYEISKLIHNGIDIKNIKLTNINSEYNFLLQKYSKLYNIPINIKNDICLFETSIGLEFIKLLSSNSLEFSIAKINESNSPLCNLIINTLNKTNNHRIENITYLFKKTKLPNEEYENAINIVSLKDNEFNNEDYHFVMSFNQGIIPIIHKDKNYITDNIASIVKIETTDELNKLEREVTEHIIRSLPNAIITYKLDSSNGSEYYPSSLVSKLGNAEKVKRDIKVSYSRLNDNLVFASMLDRYYKYGHKTNELDILGSSTFIPYLKYNNEFTGVSAYKIKNVLESKLNLSYSRLNSFYKCKFSFYCDTLLNINVFEKSMPLLIGNIFHHMVETYKEDDFDFEKEWNKFLKTDDTPITIKDELILAKIKKDVEETLKILEEQKRYSSLNETMMEEWFDVDKSKDGYKIKMCGKIDRINYLKEIDKTVLSVIDYKTGFISESLDNLNDGCSLQLPTYLYLIKNSKKINNPVFAGFHYQQILREEIAKEPGKTYEELKKNNLKLKGYSNIDKDILEKLDNSYNNSELIKSLKTKKDGDFYNYSKVISNDEINKIIDIVDKKVDECIDAVINGDFKINPIKIKQGDCSCDYCKYKDLCYIREEQIKETIKQSLEEVLI